MPIFVVVVLGIGIFNGYRQLLSDHLRKVIPSPIHLSVCSQINKPIYPKERRRKKKIAAPFKDDRFINKAKWPK